MTDTARITLEELAEWKHDLDAQHVLNSVDDAVRVYHGSYDLRAALTEIASPAAVMSLLEEAHYCQTEDQQNEWLMETFGDEIEVRGEALDFAGSAAELGSWSDVAWGLRLLFSY